MEEGNIQDVDDMFTMRGGKKKKRRKFKLD